MQAVKMSILFISCRSDLYRLKIGLVNAHPDNQKELSLNQENKGAAISQKEAY